MSDTFEGTVKAVPELVELALHNYIKELTEAKEVAKALKLRSETDTYTREHKFWFPTTKLVVEWIKVTLSTTWFLTWEDLLYVYYPNEISYKQVSLLNNQRSTMISSLTSMWGHNPSELYLNPEQAEWVNRWSKVGD
jgi:hypothetical protein